MSPIVRNVIASERVTAHGYVITSPFGRLSTRTMTYDFRRFFDRAGVAAGAPTHVFRKTLATNLLRQGVRADVVDSILGWAPTSVRSLGTVRMFATGFPSRGCWNVRGRWS
jgi:site-specific recombinase XerD